MKIKLKIIILAIILILFGITGYVEASEAENISTAVTIKYNKQTTKKLSDDSTSTKLSITANSEIKITSEKPIGSVYVKYENSAKLGTLICGTQQYNLGTSGFLHEYIQLKDSEEIKEVSLTYSENVQISEIYCFTNGEVPSWVQKWKTQDGNVDLMLFSTHSDDEHLFFAGLLPTYVAKGFNVQVIYLTNHNTTPTRLHEQLDGLWNVGITSYPVIGPFPDAFANSLEGAVKNLKSAGFTQDDVISFQVEQIRKFKPLVVVGHDEKGEYSHGQHMLNTDALKQSIVKSDDENYDEQTAKEYGIWQTPKMYLHLYQQNQITMNYDTPLDYFDGKTAYEISKIGYSYHKSQQYTWFTKWLKGPNNSYTSATQITTYSPTNFGLFYTSVGEDVQKNDMFENINKSEFRPQETVDSQQSSGNQEQSVAKKQFKIEYIVIAVVILIIIVGTIVLIRKKTIAKN